MRIEGSSVSYRFFEPRTETRRIGHHTIMGIRENPNTMRITSQRCSSHGVIKILRITRTTNPPEILVKGVGRGTLASWPSSAPAIHVSHHIKDSATLSANVLPTARFDIIRPEVSSESFSTVGTAIGRRAQENKETLKCKRMVFRPKCLRKVHNNRSHLLILL